MKGKVIVFFVCISFTLDSTDGFLDNVETTIEERLAALEKKISGLTQQLEVVQGCASDLCGIHWSSWSDWSKWLPCSGQCNQGYASREQTRSRSRTCLHDDQQASQQYCNGTSTETDRRPCNAVELYGCLNGDNTHNGSFGIAYNFFDELAQSTCTSILTRSAHAAAVRRDCYSGHAPECSTICSNLGYSCFDELHVYHPAKNLQPNIKSQTDEGVVGLSMYRYFSCTFGLGSCGPNYCCCMWP